MTKNQIPPFLVKPNDASTDEYLRLFRHFEKHKFRKEELGRPNKLDFILEKRRTQDWGRGTQNVFKATVVIFQEGMQQATNRNLEAMFLHHLYECPEGQHHSPSLPTPGSLESPFQKLRRWTFNFSADIEVTSAVDAELIP